MNPRILGISPGPAGLSEGRGFIDQALSVAGFDTATRYQITMATNEAVSNAMEHGIPCDDGRFHLAARVEYGSFVFSVRDCGEFEDAAAPPPDPVAERGRGFAFMNLPMDDVTVEELRADRDHVVAIGRIYARRQNFVADDAAGFAFKLRDGKVVWLKVYPSADEALAAAGWGSSGSGGDWVCLSAHRGDASAHTGAVPQRTPGRCLSAHRGDAAVPRGRPACGRSLRCARRCA